jgi:cysteine desulfurase/selenocysteine lyase
MPPWQGGGAMIETVGFDRIRYAPPPQRFEAGTPHIVGAIGLHAAIRWVEQVGLAAIEAHEAALGALARAGMERRPGTVVLGPADSAGILSFAIGDVHPHDIATIFDEGGVAIRAGHHCAQPLMAWLGRPATARASFSVHNDTADVDRLLRAVDRVQRIFG